MRSISAGSAGAANVAVRRPVNGRSVLLGLVGVGAIASLTGYNDYVINNTNLIGSHLPIGVLGFLLIFILFVNAPLRRWAPAYAFSSAELAVALGMMLVGCAIPSVGMMRYLPGHLTALFSYAASNPQDYALLRQLDLPDWLFPTFESSDPAVRGYEPIVQHFIGRAPVEADTFVNHFRAVPWSAWATPALTWGLFFGCIFGAVLCLAVIVRRQWAENERLPFPLASIYLSLIETPRRGAVNGLFASRAFWLAFAAVFALHSVNGLGAYFPKYFPAIPLDFDLTSIFSQPPWVYIEPSFKAAKLYLTIVGLTMLLQGSVGFSLWVFFVALQGIRMAMGSQGVDLTLGMTQDQMFGASLPYAVAILWIGRRHFGMVLRQMFRPARPGEARGRYLPYAAAGWGLALCLGGMVLWLMLAGVSLAGALVIVLMLMMLYLVTARIVAETGLLYVLFPVPINGPWTMALRLWNIRTTMRSFFFSSMFSGMLVHDLRESLPSYALHAMRVADDAAYPDERNWRRAIPFTLALILALLVSYLVSGTAILYCHYSYAASLDKNPETPINIWGSFNMPRQKTLDPTEAYLPPGTGPNLPHDRAEHFAFGAGVCAFLSLMRLRFVSWPLHPVGFLLVHTWGIQRIWFSILVGWLAKVLIVRLGGVQLFLRARPVFIGLIIGEAAVSLFWLVVALVCAAMGQEHYAMHFMPI